MLHRRLFLLLATCILLTAAGLRLTALHQYPPGPHYDEAVYLIVSRSIAFGSARFFPMVEAYQGREILYMYLNAPFLQWIHDDIFTLRMVSVFCNLLTIAAATALGRLMFRGRRGWLIGLTMGALIALSFPQLWLARQAFRAVTLPMMQALALVFLWRGLTAQRHDWRWLLIGGALAGGALYTYNSSRLFPLWLGIAALVLLLLDRARWRVRLRQGAIFFGVLILVAAPMAIYAVQRPDIFFGRLAEVTQADQSVTLGESLLLHAKMFFLDGDPYLRYNLPHRPYFTLPEGLLLLIGMGVAFNRLRRRGDPLERTAYVLALLSPLMVIPSVISVGGLPPSHMRSLGMIPLIFVLVAVGAEWVYSKLGRYLSRPYSAAVLMLVLLVIGGVLVGQTYFAWATRADVYYETDADLSAAARWLVDNHIDELVYIAARDKGHPTAMIEPLPPVTWLGTDLLFRPPNGQTGLYVFPRSAPPPDDWRAWLEPGAIPGLPLAPDGRTAFEAFRLNGDAPLPAFATLAPMQTENPYLRLIGMDAPALTSGSSGTIHLAWEVIAAPPHGDFTPLVQLEDALGSVLSRTEPYMTLTDQWRPGETLMQRIEIAVPPATPPGEYALRVAWVGRAANAYVPYVDADGLAGLWAQVGTLDVERPASDPAHIDILTNHLIPIHSRLRVLGYDLNNQVYRPGEAIPITLYWNATEAGAHSVTLNASIGGRALDSWSPFEGYDWRAGETLAERRRWVLPRDLPAGNYPLTLNGEEIGAITVEGTMRVFDVPSMQTPVGAVFSDQIELVGYTLRIEDERLFIEIAWKSTNIMVNSYKLFIHAVDNSGTILSQIDIIPRQNTYPTYLWLPGEVVTETYALDRIEGMAALRIGVYDALTLQRLPVTGNESHESFLNIPLTDI